MDFASIRKKTCARRYRNTQGSGIAEKVGRNLERGATMKITTAARKKFSLAVPLVVILGGCASQPEHPMPADYCNGGVLVCVGTNGNTTLEPGEEFSCRCDYSISVKGGLDGVPDWAKKALDARRSQSGGGNRVRKERKERASGN